MPLVVWLGDNWFNVVQSGGIIASLLASAAALHMDANARRVSNLLDITRSHREIWTNLYTRSELSRVLNGNADLRRNPVTRDEELFVNLLILHLNTAYQAMKNGDFAEPEGLRKDIQGFFSLPIPHTVWQKTKSLQDSDFVEFVTSSIPES